MAENSKQKEVPPKFITYTAGELMNMNFPEPVAVIPDLLLEGISILAAPSKMGKSWLALNLALAVASGTSFLGYETIKSGVLYFALEDAGKRLASRLKSILGDAPPPDGLKLTTKCGVIDNEFFSTLDLEIQKNNNLKLIIVDTLQKVRPVARGRSEYEEFYNFFSGISDYAQEKHLAILFIHHTRKNGAQNSDAYMDILGSTALQAATDSMFVMQGDRKDRKNIKFLATGRDISDLELVLDFDPERCIWVNLGGQEDIEKRKYQDNPIIKTITAELEKVYETSNGTKQELAITMQALQKLVQEHTGKKVGEKPRQFSSQVKKLDEYLKTIGIEHIADEKTTTINSVSGLYHRFRYVQK